LAYASGNRSADLPLRLEALELRDVEVIRPSLGVLAGLELAAANALSDRIGRASEAHCRLFGRERPHLGRRRRDGLDDDGTQEGKGR